jgi:NAD(P)-dependent dehydrogenase (short-subunit alcohol dehydrogenase family)
MRVKASGVGKLNRAKWRVLRRFDRCAKRRQCCPGPEPCVNQENKEKIMGMLDGKTAIVTGAGRGIGREEALQLAAEGAKVIVNDVGAARTGEGSDKSPAEQTVEDIKTAGGEAQVSTDDVSSWAGAEKLIKQAVDSWGKLDILVNNAGILRDKMSFNMEESDWDDVIRVHLKGHFATSHFAAAHWRNRSKAGEEISGRVVNTASESGLFGNAGQANYAAAKAGIAMLTVVPARELERYGVTVNAISPRARTRMTEDLFGEMAKAEEGKFDAFAPQNVAPLVVFLASDEASDISGQNFVVYGGSVWVMGGWKPAGELKRDVRWTPKELADNKSTLFANRSPGIPPFAF